MKQLLLSLLTISLFLTACSSEETVTEQANANNKMLKSFVVKKNADGSYVLTTQVTDGVGAIYYDDAIENQVHLVKDAANNKNSLIHNYDIADEQLKIQFISEDASANSSLTIYDDGKSEANRATDYGLLNNYSITANEDGTIQLNFEVKSGVAVNFGYNDGENINDIYLSENPDASDVSFSKSYSTESDGSLRIDFVQPASATSRESDTRKPRVIYDDCPTC